MEGLLRGHLPIGVEASRQPIVGPAVDHCSRRRVVVGSRHHGGARLAVVAAVHVAARVFVHVTIGGVSLSLIAAVAGVTVDSWL